MANSDTGDPARRQVNSPPRLIQGRGLYLLLAGLLLGLPCDAVVTGSAPDSMASETQIPWPPMDVPSNTNAYRAFKTFLETPLSVRRVRYTRDPKYYRVNKKPVSFPVEYEAAIQGDTFYVRRLTNLENPTSPPGATRIEVAGASQSDYWLVDGLTVVLADRDNAFSGRNTPPETRAGGNLRTLQDVLSLGLDGLERGTLEWVGNLRFQARSRDQGIIRGELVVGEEKPRGLLYTYDAIPNLTCRVEYAYMRDNLPFWLPSRIVRTLHLKNGSILTMTNEIQECILGTEELPAQGYTAGRFVTNVAFTNLAIMVFSNGVGYLHHGGEIVRTVLPTEAWKVHPSKHKWIRLGFFVVVAAVALLCSLLYARGGPCSGKWAKST